MRKETRREAEEAAGASPAAGHAALQRLALVSPLAYEGWTGFLPVEWLDCVCVGVCVSGGEVMK